ncbi:MAG: tripartite tricarboxylate transporter permease [Candidatus Sumerlaeia bacterium]|nr:tripartite tricarboxylate transporter permease [Candidatus Sumerlaeia bacterium]
MDFLQTFGATIADFSRHSIAFVSLENLALMLGAVVVGIVFGVLPGLSATIGIALFTGVTYGMALDKALVVLLGVYIGAIYGGSISAILINIPGTGSAAATCLDGHALALKGEAGTANTLARIASALGTLFGMVLFLFFTPLITRIAIQFTSPEFFWLAIFGILICGSMASPDLPIKGWIAGLLGILMALVGQEDIHGWERFTFGNPNLINGIPFVPMTIAFFGIPEIVKAMKGRGLSVASSVGVRRTPIAPVIRRNLLGILRWGSIGVGIGAVPGVGENIAAWVAYGDARKRHPRGREFGTGVYEGVMAPETANNAAIGGSIIPLVSLGIPGSPPAAMLLAALMIHGIRPGPLLSMENPGIIPQIGALILWGSIFMLVCGLVLTRAMEALLRIPQTILMPIIGVLCVVGVFAYENNPFHLVLVFGFGVFGYFLDRMGYPAAPLILGLILGNMADAFLRRALLLSHGNILGLINRPISFLFFLACALTIANQLGLVQRIKAILTQSRGARDSLNR